MANSVNIVLKNATIYDVSKMDVMVGEKFTLELDTAIPEVRWFSDNDPALDLITSQDTKSVDVTAKVDGPTEIWIVDKSTGNTAKKLNINVISTAASTLGLTAGEPRLKS